MFRLSKLVLVSLVILVILSTIPSAHAESWIYDDGTMEEFFINLGDLCQAAVLFTPPPPYPYYRLWKISLYLQPMNQSFKIHITDSSHNDLITPIPVTPPPPYHTEPLEFRWLDIDLTAYDIFVSGDFYVSAEFVTIAYGIYEGRVVPIGYPYLGLDSSSPISGRSYFYTPNVGWSQDTNYNYMIRVEAEPQLPPPPPPPGKREVPEFSLGIPIITSIATIVYLTIKKRASKRR